VGGAPAAGADVPDQLRHYRFEIERRSDLSVRLSTRAEIDMLLLTDGGRRLACGCDKEFERRVRPGDYLVAVRARDGVDGSYALRRLARTITRSRTLVNGRRSATIAQGGTAGLSLRVRPEVDGRATLLIERFDPLAGWLFDARFRPRVRGGLASVEFARGRSAPGA
jgi:hypothetical protein